MARYTADSKERVRDAVDMVDLVGARTELRRSGADAYVGLCPFHDERTPSFSVRPSGKVYYCFGCQAAGDAFNFVMDTEGLEFVGAMEYLADRYGVSLELEQEDPRAADERRRTARLLELLDRTCSYYERVLWEHAEGAAAREYLA
ncbi:MAG: CHC2 zinc finger domain-containing protein, partial [Solirubrobacteraceae bacterium]